MPRMPHEPEAFAESVASMLRRLQPEHSIQLAGPKELVVDGRRLDLENLSRLVNRDPDRGVEIVEHYLEHLFSTESMVLSSATFEFAKPRLMPRIQPETIFNHLTREQVAHVPFVNGTVIVFVLDLPHMTVSVTTEQMIKWGITADDLEDIARKNLDRYVPELSVQLVESREGGKAAIVSEQDGYDAARLLLSSLHRRLAPQLGGDFYVATPARDMFIAMTGDPQPFVQRLVNRVQQDYKRLPYPITDSLFFVTRDGVAGTERNDQAEAA
ncbi:MAG TPA: DUF1444 family protein [Phycisphaerales bacterium]|jgi:uncharacterized protein YtpQ (UPF0354 family)|nr:DUF1444 family protein [Phycisphaerales bacterium]